MSTPSETTTPPTAAPEAAVAVSAPVTPAAPAPAAPAKPTPHELRTGALFREPERLAAWLEPTAEPTPEPAAATTETTPPATEAPTETTEDPKPGEAEGDGAKFRRAGERGPKLEIVGADGQPVALDVAALKVRTKAGGEVVELTLPELARKAASEVGLNQQNARLQQQIGELTQAHEQRLADAQQAAQAEMERLAELTIRALTDDGVRAQLAAQVSDYYSPEQQLARERAAREAERTTLAQTAAQQQHQQAAQGFYAGVAQHLADLEQQAPHVPAAELIGHFHALTAPITGPDGRVPPQFWPQLHAIVTQELPRVARERNASLAELHDAASAAQTAKQQAETLAAETTRAQQTAQQAVNQFARATRPAGTAATGDPTPQKPPIRSLKDAQAWARGAYERSA